MIQLLCSGGVHCDHLSSQQNSRSAEVEVEERINRLRDLAAFRELRKATALSVPWAVAFVGSGETYAPVRSTSIARTSRHAMNPFY
jgi:hypothetical protein